MTCSEFRNLLKRSPEKAQRSLFDEYFNYVYTIVYSRLHICGSREDIDECTADVLSELFLRCNINNDINTDLHGLVSTIAKKRSIDAYRRLIRNNNRNIHIDESNIHELKADTNLVEQTENKIARQKLIDAVIALGEPDSTIILLKYYYDRTAKEIGKKVHLSPAAVQMRCKRAMKKLREMLEKEELM